MSIAAFMLGCCLLEAIHEGTKAASRRAYNKRHTKRRKGNKSPIRRGNAV